MEQNSFGNFCKLTTMHVVKVYRRVSQNVKPASGFLELAKVWKENGVAKL